MNELYQHEVFRYGTHWTYCINDILYLFPVIVVQLRADVSEEADKGLVQVYRSRRSQRSLRVGRVGRCTLLDDRAVLARRHNSDHLSDNWYSAELHRSI